MRIISLFSGAGGLDLGLIQAGHEIVWANDFDEDCVETYRKNIGDHIVLGSIEDIPSSEIPDAEVVVGGFPCQGFSQANMLRFEEDELRAAENRCVLTQEATSDVIEAAHIIPVGHGGTDAVGNGLCMRVDIHRLFDNGKIRIAPDGAVTLNEQIAEAVSYRDLPQNINFPANVGLENIKWRSRYL